MSDFQDNVFHKGPSVKMKTHTHRAINHSQKCSAIRCSICTQLTTNSYQYISFKTSVFDDKLERLKHAIAILKSD